jgi:dCTP deaminase
MILLGNQIKELVKDKKIIYDGAEENIGPNSVDVTLHKLLKTYVPCKIIQLEIGDKTFNKIVLDEDEIEKDNFFIRMDKPNKVYEHIIPKEGLILSPNILYLGATNEVGGSDYYLPMYEGRSSTARLGFQSHLSAGFGDISFKSNWTLEIIVIHALLVFPDVRIGQVYFHEINETYRKKLFADGLEYNSKYNKQTVAQESKMYLDFKETNKKG